MKSPRRSRWRTGHFGAVLLWLLWRHGSYRLSVMRLPLHPHLGLNAHSLFRRHNGQDAKSSYGARG